MKFLSVVTNQTVASGFLFTASYAVMPVVLAKEDQEPKLVKPKDLSIYPDEVKHKKVEKENNWEPTIALGSIQKIRDEIINLNQRWFKVKERVYTFVQTGISHSESFIDNLRDEKNATLRAGFVAGGGLAGLLVAARKGKFKKLLYASSGASAAFYFGYPKESEEATKVIKHYSIVSYHLINNVTKDITGFELPPLPTPKNDQESNKSVENKPDLKELLFSIMDSAKGLLESLKKMVFNEKNSEKSSSD
ncbi:MICOS complex subunit Mic27 isoform X2 [Sipha flava]|uniref:MICOS complex subunit n=1 Tax=Sipha flava TaxID=143950 RepID=A0A8B8GIT7_9HEMI|nr:MICOS complex subunit Mic27 isoform X2 [Sipha flava]